MKRTINFLKYRYIAMALSLGMIALFGFTTLTKGGFNFGIDFVGGAKIIAKFNKSTDEKSIRTTLKNFKPLVQQIGDPEKNEFIISTKLLAGTSKTTDEADKIRKALSGPYPKVKFLSVENVGPAIGDFLKKSAVKLFIIAVILMTIYLTFRFEFKYSVGAMVALIHDITITILFCGLMGVEINIPIIAALLTIFGYSVNDSIVLFDRVRENSQAKTKQTFLETINKSINQSFSRTLLTSLTTMVTVSALYFLGGEVLNDFAKVLLFGIVVGTFSSIYVASPMLIGWERFASKR